MRILVAPLDWGLGHTTRCVPVIQHLQSLGHTAVFAGNNWQRQYIVKTFPAIETIHLEGYNVEYSKKGGGFMAKLFAQLPGLLKTIRYEHQWVQQQVEALQIDGIISDNRYGLYHPSIPSVIMTHQVLAQSGMGPFVDNLLRRIHYKQLERFNDCWVVDVPGTPNLAGKLAHPSVMPANAKYIGLLSQVEPMPVSEQHLLILLSGPEPQRTLLADMLWQQVQQYKGKVVFVEGSDDVTGKSIIPANITYHKRITKEVLQPLIAAANMVVCRSGYSTLMDLVVLGKKAILVPTPGQTEQEFLGRHLHKEGVFYHAPQKGLNLLAALKGAETFPFHKLPLADTQNQYKPVLEDWLQKL